MDDEDLRDIRAVLRARTDQSNEACLQVDVIAAIHVAADAAWELAVVMLDAGLEAPQAVTNITGLIAGHLTQRFLDAAQR